MERLLDLRLVEVDAARHGARSPEFIVSDLGGTKQKVTVSDATTVTVAFSHSELKAGDTATISGTTSGATVTATSITVR